MEEKPRLHASALGMLSACGYQYRYRYLDGIRRPPRAAMLRGRAVHEAQDEHMSYRRDAGEFWEPDRLADATATHFDRVWRDAGEIEFEPGEDPKAVRGETKDISVGLSVLHGDFARKIDIRPLLVEDRFDIELEDFPFDLSGYVDLLDSESVIHDTKTATKTPSANGADVVDSIQRLIYPLGVEILTNERPTRFQLDTLVHLKRSRKVVSMSAPTPKTNDALLLRVESAAKVIESGAFTPANPSWWGCSEKWCGYWDRCPFGAAHRTVHVTASTMEQGADTDDN